MSRFFSVINICNILLLVIGSSSCSAIGKCSVWTTSGKLQGRCGYSASEFLSIPYAKPPTNNLRFSRAQEYWGFDTLNCTELPPYCPQPTQVEQSEDCLFLNVYAPASASFGTSIPVMVWFHGGSFLTGGSADSTFNGTILARNQNVIVVTLNYRLGVFGFYDNAETGTNFGVTDTIQALSWVKQNIAQFGGNPDRVTVFGQSSGGSMIRALLTAPSARHLFRNAIIQSDPQAFDANPQNVSRSTIGPIITDLANCSTVDCMRSVSVDSLIQAELDLYQYLGNIPNVNTAYPYGPNIDGDIVPVVFGESLENGQLQNYVDIIIGYTYNESAPTISQAVPANLNLQTYQYLLSSTYGAFNAEQILSSGYFSQTSDLQDQFTLIATQWGFECPAQYNLKNIVLHQLAPKVYGYQLTQGIEYPDNKGLSLCGGTNVCHEDDLYLLWGTYNNSNVSESQKALSQEIQARWANFAKEGNPNANGYTKWVPASSANNLNILKIGGNEDQVSETNPLQCNFFGDRVLYQWQV